MRFWNPWVNYWPLLQQQRTRDCNVFSVTQPQMQTPNANKCIYSRSVLQGPMHSVFLSPAISYFMKHYLTLHNTQALNNPHEQITWKCSNVCWTVPVCPYSTTSSSEVGVRLSKVALAAAPISHAGARGGSVMGTGANLKGKEAHGPAARADYTSAWHTEPVCQERNETHEDFMVKGRELRGWRWLWWKTEKGGGLWARRTQLWWYFKDTHRHTCKWLGTRVSINLKSNISPCDFVIDTAT